MTEPKISILVAAYNASATLPKCLDSLLNQTLTDIEVLCVDDCSEDDTYELLRRYASKDERLRVLRTPVNSGQAMARNMALNFVHAPYACMVDADDWLSNDCLQQAFQVFQQYPDTDCVPFRLIEVHEDGHEVDFGLPAQLSAGHHMSGMEAFKACLDGWQLHGLYLTRTEFYKKIPFDTTTRLYSDDNTSRLHYLHSREVRACKGIYFYRKHGSSMTTVSKFSIYRFDYIEANLSLRESLETEDVPSTLIRRFDGFRWMNFIGCYRLYLQHQADMTQTQLKQLQARFEAGLQSFNLSDIPISYRWRLGYWFTHSLHLFDKQQRLYRRVHNLISHNTDH